MSRLATVPAGAPLFFGFRAAFPGFQGRLVVRGFGGISDAILASWDPALGALGQTRLLRGAYLIASLDGVIDFDDDAGAELFVVLSRDAGHGIETVAGRLLAGTSLGISVYPAFSSEALSAPHRGLGGRSDPPPALRPEAAILLGAPSESEASPRTHVPATRASGSPDAPPMRPISATSTYTQLSPGEARVPAPAPPRPPPQMPEVKGTDEARPKAPARPSDAKIEAKREPTPLGGVRAASEAKLPAPRRGVPILDLSEAPSPETASVWAVSAEDLARLDDDATALHTPALYDPRLSKRPTPALRDRIEHVTHGTGDVEAVEPAGVRVRLRANGQRVVLTHEDTAFTLQGPDGDLRVFLGLPRA